MRAERRGHGAALAALVFAGLAGASARALADPITGFVQGQYQVFESSAPLLNPDGTTRFERRQVERWVQTVDLQHLALPRSDLRVLSSFRYTDLSYMKLSEASRSPQGSVQVTHPYASLLAAYRPSTVTGGLSTRSTGDTRDSARSIALTARTQETLLIGQVAPPGLPRLDLSWTRRHRNRDPLSPEESDLNRNARLSYAAGALSLYGSLGDQRLERPAHGIATTKQRSGAAGGTLHLTPSTRSTVELQYDFSDARSGDPARTSGSSRSHNASLSGTVQQSATTTWNGSWFVRRSEVRGPRSLVLDDQEGALHGNYDPKGPFRLLTSAGARTVRDVGRSELASYASAVAALDGTVRHGWTAVATASHVTNWDPLRGNYSVESARLGSRLRLARGLDADLDLQTTANGDTAVSDARVASDASARLRATPLKSVSFGASARIARTGSSLGSANARARSAAWDLRWRPLASLEFTGSSAVTGVLPNDRPRLRSRLAGLRWSPLQRLQVSADWSRSDQDRTSAGTQAVTGREIASAHVLALLSRALQLDTSASIADRGSARENRQLTATLTWAFRR